MLKFRQLDLYSAVALDIRDTIERLKLAYAGLFDLSVLVRACGLWNVGIKQLAVLALDLKFKERAVFGIKPTRDKTDDID